MDVTEWDCVVVGGGAAGLSAALVLCRARRRTLVVDAGRQSNLPAHGIGGLLGHDGRPPAELYAMGRAELAKNATVEVRSGEVTTATTDGAGFALSLADGSQIHTRRVLLATGMDYVTPPIPGLAELWGRSAFHCPFCHGWEARDQPLAVLANGDRAVHMALMLRGWTDDIVVLTNGPAGFTANLPVDERQVTAFVSEAGELVAVEFAAGDLSASMPQVAAAIAGGSLSAAAVVQSLLADDVGLPVPPWPNQKENADVTT